MPSLHKMSLYPLSYVCRPCGKPGRIGWIRTNDVESLVCKGPGFYCPTCFLQYLKDFFDRREEGDQKDMHHHISPLDGRYSEITKTVSELTSESATYRYRVMVEAEWLARLFAKRETNLQISSKGIFILDGMCRGDLDATDYLELARIESVTKHDVKAVELFVVSKLQDENDRVRAHVHFGCTSEDIVNVAYGLQTLAIRKVLVLQWQEVLKSLRILAAKGQYVPLLSRTHGQPASPTTMAKELAVFYARIQKLLGKLEETQITAKFNGAVGNYHGMLAGYPGIDWQHETKHFIGSLGLHQTECTTQVEGHDNICEFFGILHQLNTVGIDLAQDVWFYISSGHLVQPQIPGEIGSSTMPHKTNPIFAELAEGNFGVANALFEFYRRKLPISRLQRDLSDSTVKRTFGTAYGHTVVGTSSLARGIQKLSMDTESLHQELENHHEVLAEGIQSILRSRGNPKAYEILLAVTKGKTLDADSIFKVIQGLVDQDHLEPSDILHFAPWKYTGLANTLSKETFRL